MNAGRVETYIHSDSITSNKGGAILKVACDTDFAARTDAFIAFSAKAARLAYASQAGSQDEIDALFPEFLSERRELETALREKIAITEIHLVQL